MIIGLRIAPVAELKGSGVKVSLGFDGSVSNDTLNMIREVRQVMLLQRVRCGANALSARKALYIATKGGAQALNCEQEIGLIEVGKAAGFIAFDLSGLKLLGWGAG